MEDEFIIFLTFSAPGGTLAQCWSCWHRRCNRHNRTGWRGWQAWSVYYTLYSAKKCILFVFTSCNSNSFLVCVCILTYNLFVFVFSLVILTCNVFGFVFSLVIPLLFCLYLYLCFKRALSIIKCTLRVPIGSMWDFLFDLCRTLIS